MPVLLLVNELSCCESRMQDLQMQEMEKEEDTGGESERQKFKSSPEWKEEKSAHLKFHLHLA